MNNSTGKLKKAASFFAWALLTERLAFRISEVWSHGPCMGLPEPMSAGLITFCLLSDALYFIVAVSRSCPAPSRKPTADSRSTARPPHALDRMEIERRMATELRNRTHPVPSLTLADCAGSTKNRHLAKLK